VHEVDGVDGVVEETEDVDEVGLVGEGGGGDSHLVEQGSPGDEEEDEVEGGEPLVLVEVEEEVTEYITIGGLIFCVRRSVRVTCRGCCILNRSHIKTEGSANLYIESQSPNPNY
jgi:hypothetical protein